MGLYKELGQVTVAMVLQLLQSADCTKTLASFRLFLGRSSKSTAEVCHRVCPARQSPRRAGRHCVCRCCGGAVLGYCGPLPQQSATTSATDVAEQQQLRAFVFSASHAEVRKMERAAHCLREGLQAGCLDGAQVPELHKDAFEMMAVM